jgi:limonene-1,2-epoxide hydrolase
MKGVDRSMSQATMLEKIRDMLAAFDKNDMTELITFVTIDVRLQLMNTQPVQGQHAFAAAVGAFHDSVARVRHEILDLWIDGETVVAELRVHYTRLDGREVALPCCNVFRLHEGCITDYRSYMDATPVYA